MKDLKPQGKDSARVVRSVQPATDVRQAVAALGPSARAVITSLPLTAILLSPR